MQQRNGDVGGAALSGASPGTVTTDPLQDLRWRLQMSEQVRRKTVRSGHPPLPPTAADGIVAPCSSHLPAWLLCGRTIG